MTAAGAAREIETGREATEIRNVRSQSHLTIMIINDVLVLVQRIDADEGLDPALTAAIETGNAIDVAAAAAVETGKTDIVTVTVTVTVIAAAAGTESGTARTRKKKRSLRLSEQRSQSTSLLLLKRSLRRTQEYRSPTQ